MRQNNTSPGTNQSLLLLIHSFNTRLKATYPKAWGKSGGPPGMQIPKAAVQKAVTTQALRQQGAATAAKGHAVAKPLAKSKHVGATTQKVQHVFRHMLRCCAVPRPWCLRLVYAHLYIHTYKRT